MTRPAHAAEAIRDFRPCWEDADVDQVLARLYRAARDRLGKSQRRRNDRKVYTMAVQIGHRRCLPDGSRAILHVLSRTLSRSGMGLLAPMFFAAEAENRNTSLLRTTEVFHPGSVLEIGLTRHNGEMLWLYGTVIQSRTVETNYLDIGLRFNGRLQSPEEWGLA